jgi:FtsP/CotA-like multicopper oxidase with cupredoxin domain
LPTAGSGSLASEPTVLYSTNGVLPVAFDYCTSVDDGGRTLFSLVIAGGVERPTLHLQPGDTLELTVTNLNPTPPPGSPVEITSNVSDKCGSAVMTITALNVHFRPGLYWYHPHVHGLSEAAVQGEASGAIVVDGIQNLQSAVAGLPARVLLIRDGTIPNGPTPGGATIVGSAVNRRSKGPPDRRAKRTPCGSCTVVGSAAGAEPQA